MSKAWIQTYTRTEPTFPLDLSPDQVCIEDIAHSLALTCRWRGHTRTFYSVAEHSIRVARLLPKEDRIYGLLHDAGEAYLSDLAAPIKGLFAIYEEDSPGCRTSPPFVRCSVRTMEDRVLSTVYRSLGIAEPTPGQVDAVKRADLVLLATEARDLMHGIANWQWEPPEPLDDEIVAMEWQAAELLFLNLLRELMSA